MPIFKGWTVKSGVKWTEDKNSITITCYPKQLRGKFTYKLYTHTWKNYCPTCKSNGTLQGFGSGKGESGVEGGIRCKKCDADFCGVSGYDTISSNSKRHLTAGSSSSKSAIKNETNALDKKKALLELQKEFKEKSRPKKDSKLVIPNLPNLEEGTYIELLPPLVPEPKTYFITSLSDSEDINVPLGISDTVPDPGEEYKTDSKKTKLKKSKSDIKKRIMLKGKELKTIANIYKWLKKGNGVWTYLYYTNHKKGENVNKFGETSAEWCWNKKQANCFAKDTELIISDNGIYENITIGELYNRYKNKYDYLVSEKVKIASIDEETSKIEWQPILGVYDNGYKEIVKLKSSTGSFKATLDHEICYKSDTRSDEIKHRKISDIKKSNALVCTRGRVTNYDTDIKPFWQLIGFILGDGNIRTNGISIGLINEFKIEYLTKIFDKLNLTNIHKGLSNGKKYTYFGINKSDKVFKDIINQLGFNKDCSNIQITNENILSLLSGLISSDGNLRTQKAIKINFLNTDYEMVKLFKTLSYLVGFDCTVHERKKSKTQFGNKKIYSCDFSTQNKDLIEKLNLREFNDSLINFKPILSKTDNEIKLTQIKELKPLGIDRVYNLTVKKNHNLLIGDNNSFLVKQCVDFAWIFYMLCKGAKIKVNVIGGKADFPDKKGQNHFWNEYKSVKYDCSSTSSTNYRNGKKVI